MDSHHPVLPDTGAIASACDCVDSCAILHRAVEGGLESGKGKGQETKGNGETVRGTETKGRIILQKGTSPLILAVHPSR